MPKGGPDGGDGGRGGDVVLVCDDSRRDLSEFHRGAHFKAKRGGHGEGSQRHGASAPALEVRVPPGTVAEDEEGSRWDLVRPGQHAVVARGGGGRPRQQVLRPLHPPDPPDGRARAPRRGGLGGAAAQAAGGRGPGGPAQRREELAARAPHRRAPEGRGLPVHHARARARDDRGRRPPARARRHPGPDRGRQRGRRASGTSSSRTWSAAACSCTCSTWRRSTAATPRRTTRPSRPSCAITAPGWPSCRGSSACPRPTSWSRAGPRGVGARRFPARW